MSCLLLPKYWNLHQWHSSGLFIIISQNSSKSIVPEPSWFEKNLLKFIQGLFCVLPNENFWDWLWKVVRGHLEKSEKWKLVRGHLEKTENWRGGTLTKVKSQKVVRGHQVKSQKSKEGRGHLVKREKKWRGTSSKVKREKRGGGTSSSSSMIPDNSSSVRGPRSSAENWKNINLCHFESTYIKLSQINLHAWLSHQINSHIKPLKVSVEMKPWPSLLQILITFITSIHMNDETMDE